MKRNAIRLLAWALALAAVLPLPAAASGYLSTSVIKLNSPPVAEDLSFETYAGVPRTGDLTALDPEGDPVTFSIT